jgi:hypothetical protein
LSTLGSKAPSFTAGAYDNHNTLLGSLIYFTKSLPMLYLI